jgi:NAD-dependent dihydropyrimidine dehydrogenase PreA subunit
VKKALVNYWVDMVTGVAFIVCAVTGIVFLFPGAVHTAVGATPTIVVIPAVWWHKVHDWSGVAMVAGTALHLALHAKWITGMTRKVFGEPAQTAPAQVGRPGRAALPALAAAAAQGDAKTPALLSPAEADAAAAASLERLETLRAERDLERQRRISRRRFLAGAATVGGAALLAGLGIVGRDAASGASTRLRDDGWTSSDQGRSGGGSSSASAGETAGSSSGGTAGSAQSSGSSGAATTAIVSVNQSACVACGRCLQICPKGVFDWSSSGRAEAVNPDACIRCGRCLQVCPAGAITVNA